MGIQIEIKVNNHGQPTRNYLNEFYIYQYLGYNLLVYVGVKYSKSKLKKTQNWLEVYI